MKKTVAALRMDGSTATADFLDLLVRAWKMVNIKDKAAHIKLCDSSRKPFYHQSDSRLGFLRSLADSVTGMKGGKGASRHFSLTSDTRSSLAVTLNGLCHLIEEMLSRDHSYVLPGHIQSDRIEAEFGIYRLTMQNFIRL